MPWFRCTQFFEASSAGWSETWYVDASDIANAQVRNRSMADDRADLCTKDVTIIHLRTQALDAPYQVRAETVNFVSSTDYGAGARADMPWTGVLLRVTSNGNQRRLSVLRGIPDDVIVGSWFNGPTSAVWLKEFARWKEEMVAQGWGIGTFSAAQAAKNVESIIVDPPTGNVVVGVTAHGYTTGDLVFFKGTRTQPCIRGRKKITAAAANTFTIVGTNIHHITVNALGTVRRFVPSAIDITDIKVERKAKRDTGRPFGLLVGRRRTCKR